MKSTAQRQKIRVSECGSVLPVVAIVAGIIITGLMIFAVDYALVRQASLVLSQTADLACRGLAKDTIIQSEAARKFTAIIQTAMSNPDVIDARLQITRAKLAIPTMPSNGDFSSNPKNQSAPVIPTFVDTTGLIWQSCPFDCSNLPAGQCDHDCQFSGTSVTGKSHFPQEMWNDSQNVGNTVTCELGGVVSTFVLGKRYINAKASWQLYVQGLFNKGSPSGVTIVFAPYGTTRADDPRFRFPYPAIIDNYNDKNAGIASYGLLDQEREQWDPLFQFGTPSGDRGFSGTPNLNTPYPNNNPVAPGPLALPRPISDNFNRLNELSVPPPCDPKNDPGCRNLKVTVTGGERYANSTNDILSDREEMLAACMNPLNLVRNTFMSTILELASRHGNMRATTELLMPEPENRELQNPADLNSLPLYSNAPVVLVPFGSDLSPSNPSDRYELPFISFDSGDALTVQGEYLPDQNGYIDPFTPGTELQQHHALVAQQLRYCYHLFHQSANDDFNIDRYPIDGLGNAGFEPASIPNPNNPDTYFQSSSLRPGGYDPAIPGHQLDWDQACPWGGTAGGCDNGSVSRKLRAPELVAAMGSIQLCPYEQGGLQGSFADSQRKKGEQGVCIKPDSNPDEKEATFDLRADLVGTLRYIAGESTNNGNFPTNYPAVLSPGLFPFQHAPGANHPTNRLAPFAAPAQDWMYTFATGAQLDTPILMVLSQRINASEEDAIRKLVMTNFDRRRPITVVYFPMEHKDREAAALNRIKNAFNITDPSSGDPLENTLLVLDPFANNLECPGGSNTDFCFDTDKNPENWRRFRDYWMYLLKHPTDNIQNTARTIFFTRLNRAALKF